MEQQLFTVKETAKILNISTKSVYRLCDRGLLKYSNALRHHMITKQSIENFVKEANNPK